MGKNSLIGKITIAHDVWTAEEEVYQEGKKFLLVRLSKHLDEQRTILLAKEETE